MERTTTLFAAALLLVVAVLVLIGIPPLPPPQVRRSYARYTRERARQAFSERL